MLHGSITAHRQANVLKGSNSASTGVLPSPGFDRVLAHRRRLFLIRHNAMQHNEEVLSRLGGEREALLRTRAKQQQAERRVYYEEHSMRAQQDEVAKVKKRQLLRDNAASKRIRLLQAHPEAGRAGAGISQDAAPAPGPREAEPLGAGTT